MNLSLNTLRFLYALLCSQQINAGAPRSEIDAVLAAREELEAAITKVENPPTGNVAIGDLATKTTGANNVKVGIAKTESEPAT